MLTQSEADRANSLGHLASQEQAEADQHQKTIDAIKGAIGERRKDTREIRKETFATGSYKDVLRLIPKQTLTKIKALGVDASRKDVIKLINTVAKTPDRAAHPVQGAQQGWVPQGHQGDPGRRQACR